VHAIFVAATCIL